jgi:hypothetical protein
MSDEEPEQLEPAPGDWDAQLAWMARFGEFAQVALPGVREQLTDLVGSLRRLLEAIRSHEPRGDHLVPDLVSRVLAWYAHSAGKGVFLTVMHGAPRASWACARTGVEAAQDLAYLSICRDYDAAGTRIWLYSHLDEESEALAVEQDFPELAERGFPGFLWPDFDSCRRSWEKASPEKSNLIERTLELVHADRARGRHHWSGLKGGRRAVMKSLREHPCWGGSPLVMDSMYRPLCRWSHARPRIGCGWRGPGPQLPILMATVGAASAMDAFRRLIA